MRYCVYVAVLVGLTAVSALGIVAWYHPRTDRPGDTGPASLVESSTPPEGPRILFRDLAKAAGITFRHIDGRTDIHYVPEIMGGGAAWIDYDQDGYLDLFLVQGSKFPPDPNEKPTGPTSRLYRNQGDGTFVDVTEQVGIVVPGFGQGVAVGDYDNDGYPDLLVACYGHCHLYHNEPHPEGGRRFREVTKEAGIQTDGWCTSCAFGDIHNSGYLDLFICQYVVMDLKNYPFCHQMIGKDKVRIACGPKEFRGSRSYLFRNNGNGTFTDVSAQAGLDANGKGLGVLILDLDDDGKADIFVGNDEVPNSHYRNLGHGKLQSCAVLSGTAANWQGAPMGSMGVEADDVSGNGRPDIFITTFYHEGTLLFRNLGKNLFTDVSQGAGMYSASWNRVGWGTCLLDVDRDGALDVFVVNGHVYRNAGDLRMKSENGELHTFAQQAQLFLGNGKGRFQLVQDAGPYFQEAHVGRGVAMGDYDNDGAMDIAINNCGEPAALLHNETQTPHHWVRLQLEGSRHKDPQGSNRDAIGAKVTVKAGGRTLVRHVKGGGSYLSNHDRRLLVGVGTATQVDEVEVRWPNQQATVQRFGPLQADRSYKLVEGGAAEPALCPPLRKR
jgi:hypothetical protein